ncbi:hypothetical protein DYB25_003061 [Aphanomyces astaci]|uniref:Uncharacterized protein n=1 Tax=Aphanomyces astaci TaxID=112090 RepID=A0A396ZSV2_APHAT|nr:hypothetical protein DYB25_003061 [Aphanomyces astaci]RHZ19324.1 hypothetical protein DYB31_001085 [Aphanomyces astaci]
MEFQTLASLVRSLKEESCRHLQLETETQTEMEYLNAQATSTRKGLGKLAELLTDDLSVMRADLQHEMQAVQVDCINRVEELTAAVERLSFRFTHHIRGNCQALGDEADRLKDTLHQTKAHLHRTDAEMGQHSSRLTAAGEMHDRRWDSVETTRIRHDTLVHSVIHDLISLRDQVGDVAALRQMLQRHMDRAATEAQHGTRDYHALESRVASLSAALDTSRTQHQYAHETLETTTSLRLDALAGALELALRAVLASTTAHTSTTTTPVATTKRVDVV